MSVDVDYQWLSRNSYAFRKYAGFYVAIVGRDVVGFGKTAEEAYRMASEKCGGKTPAVGYVRKGDGGLHLLTGQAGG